MSLSPQISSARIILETQKAELEQSGYELYTGLKLKAYKEQVFDFVRLAKEKGDVHDTNVVNILQLTDNELDNLSKCQRL